MDRITSNVSNFQISELAICILLYIILAERQFCVSRDVDLIIRNGQLWDIICMEQHRLGKNLPIYIKSQLGWVFGGWIRTDQIF